jgi:hypothetical protein
MSKHDAIREKYGIGKSASDLDPPTRDTVYSVESENVSMNIKWNQKKSSDLFWFFFCKYVWRVDSDLPNL